MICGPLGSVHLIETDQAVRNSTHRSECRRRWAEMGGVRSLFVLSVSVASPFHRHSLSTPLATLTAVTRVTKERRKHDGVREEPSKPWAGENGTVKETTIPYLSHPHHMVTARDERNEQGPHVMGSGLMFPVPYAPTSYHSLSTEGGHERGSPAKRIWIINENYEIFLISFSPVSPLARPVSKDRELSYGSGLVSSSYHPRSTEGRGLDGIIEYRKLVPAVVPPFMNPTNKIHEIRSAPYSHLSHLFLLVGLWWYG